MSPSMHTAVSLGFPRTPPSINQPSLGFRVHVGERRLLAQDPSAPGARASALPGLTLPEPTHSRLLTRGHSITQPHLMFPENTLYGPAQPFQQPRDTNSREGAWAQPLAG